MYNWFNSKRTQNLYRRQVKNLIKIWGIPIIYIRKKFGTPDKLYGEDLAISYEETIKMKMFLENMEFYEGGGQMFGSFGMELSNQMRFKVEVDDFNQRTGLDRPQEGDLIAIEIKGALDKINPNNKTYDIFKIKGVEPRNDFYALGTFFSHLLECDRFKYNHQKFNTGIPEIDALNQITDDKSNFEKMGDNVAIDDLNVNGVEVFSNITGKIENPGKPVVEENECSPSRPQKQESSDWDPNDPYNTGG